MLIYDLVKVIWSDTQPTISVLFRSSEYRWSIFVGPCQVTIIITLRIPASESSCWRLGIYTSRIWLLALSLHSSKQQFGSSYVPNECETIVFFEPIDIRWRDRGRIAWTDIKILCYRQRSQVNSELLCQIRFNNKISAQNNWSKRFRINLCQIVC